MIQIQCDFCKKKFKHELKAGDKRASCPTCGASIDLDTALKTEVKEKSPSKQNIKIAFLLWGLTSLIGVFFYLSFSRVPQTPENSWEQEHKPKERFNALWKERYDLEKDLFNTIPQKLRENPEEFGRSLYQIYSAFRKGEEKWEEGKRYITELNKIKEFGKTEDEITIVFLKIIPEKEKWALNKCKMNLSNLGTALTSQIFEQPNLPLEESLSKTLLYQNYFFEYRLLFCPAHEASLYWDWDIGVHYCLSTSIINKLSGKKQEIWAWDKVPHLVNGKKLRCVLRGNREVEVWDEARFDEWCKEQKK